MARKNNCSYSQGQQPLLDQEGSSSNSCNGSYTLHWRGNFPCWRTAAPAHVVHIGVASGPSGAGGKLLLLQLLLRKLPPLLEGALVLL